MPEYIPLLQKLDLSQTAAKVYISLLELGKASAGKVAKRAGIYKANAYDALEKLAEIGLDIIEEMQEKIHRLKVPKYVSRRAVLIHVNGVKDEVLDTGYFSQIIAFDRFLLS